MTLRTRGYTLLKATDGEEALKTAINEHPDLIIMDIQLPKMSGLEVTGKLRKMPEFKDTLIVAITAYAMSGDREKFIAAGCDTYVAKPINTHELPGIIAGMLAARKRGIARPRGES